MACGDQVCQASKPGGVHFVVDTRHSRSDFSSYDRSDHAILSWHRADDVFDDGTATEPDPYISGAVVHDASRDLDCLSERMA